MKTVRKLGFVASAHRRLVKGKGGRSEVGLDVMPGARTPFAMERDRAGVAFTIPPHLAALHSELIAEFGALREMDPVFQLPTLHAWLDERCGKDGWSYAEKGIVAKPFRAAIVFALRNEKTGEVFVVATLGDHAERIREAGVVRSAEAWLR
jgi:hypothetical protein